MNRIFIPETVLNQSPLEITGELHHQTGRVLRSRPGDHITAICGDGYEYEVCIQKIEKSKTIARLIDKRFVDNEPAVEIILYQGNLKGKSMDEIIPPLVYLGVSKLVPVKTARSEGNFDPSSDPKMKRVDGIVQKATALCHRTKLMKVSRQLELKKVLDDCRSNLLNLIFWEDSEPISLKKTLEKILSQYSVFSQDFTSSGKSNISLGNRVSAGIFIGPEGGFNTDEMQKAKSAGVIQASLGRRILDAKTAPLVAITAMLYELEDL